MLITSPQRTWIEAITWVAVRMFAIWQRWECFVARCCQKLVSVPLGALSPTSCSDYWSLFRQITQKWTFRRFSWRFLDIIDWSPSTKRQHRVPSNCATQGSHFSAGNSHVGRPRSPIRRTTFVIYVACGRVASVAFRLILSPSDMRWQEWTGGDRTSDESGNRLTD